MDPRVDPFAEKVYAIFTGGKRISWQPTTTNNISNSGITYSINPPNPGVFVDRKIYKQLPVRIQLNCATPNTYPLLRNGYDAPRSFPISSATSTLSATLNNTQFSIQLSDVIQALVHCNTGEDLKTYEYSSTPSYLDQSANYSDLQGTMRNPLSNFGNSSDGENCPRGGFSKFTIVSNTPSQAIIDCVFIEPVFLSPFYFGAGMAEGFLHIQQMNFVWNFIANAAFRMWSHDISGAHAPGAITSGAVAFSNFTSLYSATAFTYRVIPTMFMCYISPKETMPIPPICVYPYFNYSRYSTDLGTTIPAGDAGANPPVLSSATIVAQNIQLASIPKRLIIFVRPQNSILERSPNISDHFANITNLTINYNNNEGLFSNADAHDLYIMSRTNGLNMSWEQWSGGPVYSDAGPFIGTLGGPIIVEFGKDIGLDGNEAPGKLGNYNLLVQVTANNQNQTNEMLPTLYVIVISEGSVTCENLDVTAQIGIISTLDILDAQTRPDVSFSYNDVMDVNGGNWYTGLKDFGKRIFGVAKRAWPYLKGAFDIAKFAAPIIGLGEGGELIDKSQHINYNATGGCDMNHMRARMGNQDGVGYGSPVGGAMMNSRRNTLAARLAQL